MRSHVDSDSPKCLPAIIIALAQRTLAVPVLYLFSTQLSLADALSIVFRGISLPKEEVLVEYTCDFVCR